MPLERHSGRVNQVVVPATKSCSTPRGSGSSAIFSMTRSFRSTPIWIRITTRKWRSAAGISMHSKRLEPHELDKIATATLSYYEQRADDFRAGTRDHDVSQNIAALLRHIDGESPLVILDFGCGPGRDLKTFCRIRPHGYRAG